MTDSRRSCVAVMITSLLCGYLLLSPYAPPPLCSYGHSFLSPIGANVHPGHLPMLLPHNFPDTLLSSLKRVTHTKRRRQCGARFQAGTEAQQSSRTIKNQENRVKTFENPCPVLLFQHHFHTFSSSGSSSSSLDSRHSNICGVQLGFQHQRLCCSTFFPSATSSWLAAVQPSRPVSLSNLVTTEDGEEGSSEVTVHPSKQEWVGKGGAPSNHVEHGVEETGVTQVQHRAVSVCGQLEGMEGQLAVCRAGVATSCGPDTTVSKGDKRQWQEVPQEQDGHAGDGSLHVLHRPLLHTHLEKRHQR